MYNFLTVTQAIIAHFYPLYNSLKTLSSKTLYPLRNKTSLPSLSITPPVMTVSARYSLMFFCHAGSWNWHRSSQTHGMECMDFNKYKNGKSMEGTVSSLALFTEKAQAAIPSAVIGIILVAVGYNSEL